MKTTKIIYWVTTSIICLFASSAIFMNSKMAIEGTTHLGIPRWLGLEVSIGQLIGLVLLIIPAVPARFKEWAYVGFGIMYITATVAHIAVGDPFRNRYGNCILWFIVAFLYQLSQITSSKSLVHLFR